MCNGGGGGVFAIVDGGAAPDGDGILCTGGGEHGDEPRFVGDADLTSSGGTVSSVAEFFWALSLSRPRYSSPSFGGWFSTSFSPPFCSTSFSSSFSSLRDFFASPSATDSTTGDSERRFTEEKADGCADCSSEDGGGRNRGASGGGGRGGEAGPSRPRVAAPAAALAGGGRGATSGNCGGWDRECGGGTDGTGGGGGRSCCCCC